MNAFRSKVPPGAQVGLSLASRVGSLFVEGIVRAVAHRNRTLEREICFSAIMLLIFGDW